MGDLGYYAIFSDTKTEHIVYNYANLGGCQTRNRLIARWVRSDYLDNIPYSAKFESLFDAPHIIAPSLDPELEKAKSWLETIKPFLDTLPKTTIKTRLANNIKLEFYKSNSYYICELSNDRDFYRSWIRDVNKPCFTLATSGSHSVLKTPKKIQSEMQFLDDTIIYKLNALCLAAIQGLPSDAHFSGQIELDRKMIGNSVPPAMIKKVWDKFNEY